MECEEQVSPPKDMWITEVLSSDIGGVAYWLLMISITKNFKYSYFGFSNKSTEIYKYYIFLAKKQKKSYTFRSCLGFYKFFR